MLETAKKEEPKVTTVEECPKCGLKSKRKFQQGDYVIKRSGTCPKCNIPMYIKMIYLEEEPKA
jgi:formate dehydrogenase maturation protein FdhE